MHATTSEVEMRVEVTETRTAPQNQTSIEVDEMGMDEKDSFGTSISIVSNDSIRSASRSPPLSVTVATLHTSDPPIPRAKSCSRLPPNSSLLQMYPESPRGQSHLPPGTLQTLGLKRNFTQMIVPSIATAPANMYPSAASPGGRLFRDGLHTVFQFLSFKELASTSQVNQNWLNGSRTMNSRLRKDTVVYSGPIHLLMRTHLRTFIKHLCFTFPSNSGFDSNVLSLLRDHMSHLDSLTMITQDQDQFGSAESFIIPSHLRELRIRFKSSTQIDLVTSGLHSYLSGCIKQIAAQATQLVKLEVNLEHVSGVMNCPPELSSITTLTVLTLPFQINRQQQIALIQSLPSIQRWFSSSGDLECALLQRLVDNPPPQLRSIDRISHVDEPIANQLKRLSTLTHLDLGLYLPNPTILLPHFPRLTILKIHYDYESVDVNLLAQALSNCVTLTDLHLEQYSSGPNRPDPFQTPTEQYHDQIHSRMMRQLRSDHINQFLPHLISLTRLKFVGCLGLVSLEFLSSSKTTLTQLRSLSLVDCRNIPIREYVTHLSAISQSLQYLTIDHSSKGRVDQATVDGWTLGCNQFSRRHWPQLIKFSQTDVTCFD